jgi:hypothetical protein
MDRPRLAVWSLPLTALLAGVCCSSDNGGTTAPTLLNAFVAADGMETDLLAAPDGGTGAFSPRAQLRLVFDQLLDGDKIETVLDGGGVEGMSDVASLTWMGAPAGAPAIAAITMYDPSGGVIENMVSKPRPSITIQPTPGLPSGATLTLKLDSTKVTSKKGTPLVDPGSQTFETVPFTVEAGFMDGDPLTEDAALKLTFTNVPADDIAHSLGVTMAGAPVEFETRKDDMDVRAVVLVPKRGLWALGGGYALTVSAEAADLFGVKVSQPLSAGFSVVRAGVDGGGIPEGGASGDGGGTDGGAPSDGPVDAATDSAVDAAPDAAAADAI